jgi:hypothetical protein
MQLRLLVHSHPKQANQPSQVATGRTDEAASYQRATHDVPASHKVIDLARGRPDLTHQAPAGRPAEEVRGRGRVVEEWG